VNILKNGMITNVMSISVYVLNLEKALDFYTQSLGFNIHTDIRIGPQTRWASVYLPDEPSQQLMLIPVEEGMLFTGEQVIKLKELIRLNTFSFGVFKCRDLAATTKWLKAKGVRFLMEPGIGFLGQYEASFMDNSGNWFRLSQDNDAV
jgi:catechol 2,3-dioxygenase-like lactoylglutathione lyase family enzyme